MKLRVYQKEDAVNIIAKATAVGGVGVFNEQRTGKTPTSLVSTDKLVNGRVLVVSPASMVLKWADEAETWTSRPVFTYVGTPKQRQKELDSFLDSANGYLIVSYDLFKTTKTNQGLKDLLRKPKVINGLIVDESHRAVGRKTANFKSLRTLINTPTRLYLTGTPAPNHPAQVWALLTMIDPKAFPSYWRFVEEYFHIEEQKLPAHVAQKAGTNHIQTVGDFKPDKEDAYLDLLHRYCIMRKREDVMPWLPKKEKPTRIKLPLTKPQEKYLHELSNYFETEHIITQGILDQLIRYRQICLAPKLLGLKGSSPKLDWLESYMKDYPDKSVVVFSRFTQFLKLAAEKLGMGVGVLVGDTPLSQRKLLIDGFQNGKIRLLLIQIDAGKEGLTLDQADTLIFTDTYPPASDILQARDRIVATTEQRNKPKEVIELCMTDSYDEALYDLVDGRMESTDIANNYINYIKERSES